MTPAQVKNYRQRFQRSLNGGDKAMCCSTLFTILNQLHLIYHFPYPTTLSLHDHTLCGWKNWQNWIKNFAVSSSHSHVCMLLETYRYMDFLIGGRSFYQYCVTIWVVTKNLINSKKTPELVEFLQMSAIDRLTTFRQLEARDFGSVATIVTTDFEAMYAYKRGDYQHCFQLSAQNVWTLLHVYDVTALPLFLEFLQLLDDDIVSLTALTLLVNLKCRFIQHRYGRIRQMTLSLYLMIQCQLKLRHSLASLALTLDWVEVAQRKNPVDEILDHLTLKLAERKILTRISQW